MKQKPGKPKSAAPAASARKQAAPAPQYEPHPQTEKSRESWFFLRSSFPQRDALPFDLESVWRDQHKFPRAANVDWQETGPRNWAGRVTCLLSDPQDYRILYAGSAAGGLWRSRNLGKKWDYVWPKYLNQNIGAIAAAPDDSKFIICATGEANAPSGTYPGAGVFYSSSHGRLWESFISAPGGAELEEESARTLPRRIACIAFGTPSTSHQGRSPIAFGCVTRDDSRHAGLYLDTGAEGFKFIEIFGQRSYNCYAVVFHPAKKDRILISVETRGSLSGIWRTDNFGKKWEQLNRFGLPPGENCGRISLAMSPSDPETIYALVGGRSRLHGVYKTVTGGDKWIPTDASSFSSGEGQHGYNNTIAVHPTDPGFVVCGITNLHRTRNGGGKWEPISTGKRGEIAGTPRPRNLVHADQHAILILDKGPNPLLIAGHDGGVSVSENGGDDWEDRSTGMVTTMFYDIDVAPSNSRVFGGGAQDTGSVISGVLPDGSLATEDSDPTQYIRVLPSDGSFLEFDPDDERRVFGSTSGSRYSRHDPGEPFSFGDIIGGWTTLTPPLSEAEKALRAFTLLAIRPATKARARQFWFATSGLWNSTDDGATWKPASPVFDFSAISALAFSQSNPDLIVAGTTSGGVYRSLDNGASWSPDLAGPDIPRRIVTKIQIHPRNPNSIALCVGSTTVMAASLNGDALPYSHVFWSDDLGATWSDIDERYLPNVVYNSLDFEAHPPYRLFAGGDAGVWCLDQDGWVNISGTLPNVIVSDLDYHAKDRILTAGTFGRGIWRLPIPKGTFFARESTQVFTRGGEDYIAPPATGLLRDITIDPPRIVSPKFDIVLNDFPRTVKLKWTAVPRAIGYIVRLESEFGIFESQFAETNSLEYTFGGDGRTSWRVWALLPDSRNTIQSNESSLFFFTGNTPFATPSPEPISPPNGARLKSRKVTFSWAPLSGARKYWLRVQAIVDGLDFETSQEVQGTSAEIDFQLAGAYSWSVAAFLEEGRRFPVCKPRKFTLP